MISTLYKIFQHWSANGSVYLIGDLHLGDDVCKRYYDNWPSPTEQIQLLKETCNGRQNTLIVLGDVGCKFRLLNKLNCKKVLVKGNHDAGQSIYSEVFDEIYAGPLFIAEKILLSHEPFLSPFAVNIHGHDHRDKHIFHLDRCCKHVNLAANVVNYKPQSLAKLIKENGVMSGIKGIHREEIDFRNEGD